MRLSNNFWLYEFTRSQQATRLGLDNTPTEEHLENIKRLVVNVLQPISNHFQKAVNVSSGYRSPEVNRRVGGSSRSQHMLGEAADIEINGMANYDLAEWIMENLEFDQLILEFAKQGDPNAGWVHVSFRQGENRKDVKTAMLENGKTVYYNGLIKT